MFFQKDPYKVLGLKPGATQDEAKAAFRRLAMKHHPDRGGSAEEFKKIKEAYEKIKKDGEKKSGSFREFKDSFYERDYEYDCDFGSERRWFKVTLTPDQALKGTTVKLDGTSTVLPPGLPNGFVYKTYAEAGCEYYEALDAYIEISIERPGYVIAGVNPKQSGQKLFSAALQPGDVEVLPVSVNAADLIIGTWITIQDLFGEELSVRVPAGFDPECRLKVAGKGYIRWNENKQEPTYERGHLYVQLKPVFTALNKLPSATIQKLQGALDELRKNAG